ncbi:MAG: BrnT family toxin [Sandaracinaceae bacterium]|nr:BrnT family toxin [Sandaracinaceae bacterium]MBK8406372.1 BrnT family toxin [Sandaracinaceae bacterium]MBK8591313.1 BrnT family toxin [Sandaracinaceae bacterium]
MRFEWDPKKDRQNVTKHGVSFKEAEELFTSDADFLEIYDAEHSHTEERFIAIGPVRRGLVLVVYTERSDDIIRIISARWASSSERTLYVEHMEQHT